MQVKLFQMCPGTGRRSAATLVEVLMSLLIMSLGIVGVFTLFPVSLLSSIKANQLTTARLFADQIASTIRYRPEVVLGATPWEPGRTYAANGIATPPIPAGGVAPELTNFWVTPTGGTTGYTKPDWRDFPETDGSVTWSHWNLLPTNESLVQTDAKFVTVGYVVDPYGAIRSSVNGTVFGNDQGVVPSDKRVLRIHGGASTESAAFSERFALRDTWSVVETVVPESVDAVDTNTDSIADVTVVTFPDTMDVSSTPTFGAGTEPLARLVVVSADGRRSQAGYVAANSLTDSTLTSHQLRVNSLLLGATTPGPVTDVSQVRLEMYERRYTWLGAVRRRGTHWKVQIAIMFNRAFREEDEQVYNYSLGGSGMNDTANVEIPSGMDPYIVEGGYAFNVGTVTFHRIVDVSSKSAAGATIVVTPELDPDVSPRQMIFLPGIVHVYETQL